MQMQQITDTLIMVRPAHFGYNIETAANNAFQSAETTLSIEQIEQKALTEFDLFVKKLRGAGVEVIVITDTPDPVKHDAIFPNNWVTLHQNGKAILYPMYAPIRRLERREDVIQALDKQFDLTEVLHLEQYEAEDRFLEGTGSMILDRPNQLAYACRSPRTNEKVFNHFCRGTSYQKILFNATDGNGQDIYHTNVMMAIGMDFVVICMEAIKNIKERAELQKRFAATGKAIIEISLDQMMHFAGNMLQVQSQAGVRYLVMSEQAFKSLTAAQIEKIEQYTNILHSPLYTIEQFGGGSARCMLAENFLPKRVEEE